MDRDAFGIIAMIQNAPRSSLRKLIGLPACVAGWGPIINRSTTPPLLRYHPRALDIGLFHVCSERGTRAHRNQLREDL